MISLSILDYYSPTTWYKPALSTRLSGINCDQASTRACTFALVAFLGKTIENN